MSKKLLALFLALLIPAQVSAAITRGATATGNATDDFAFDATVAATANAFLIVACNTEEITANTLTATYNTVAMTEIRERNHSASQVTTVVLGLVAPAVGTLSVAVALTADVASCIAIPYYGVDQTTPTSSPSDGEFSAATDSGAISTTCSSPNFAFAFIGTASDANFTAAGEITEVQEFDSTGHSTAFAEDTTPDGTVSAQWTMALGETGTHIAFCINAAADTTVVPGSPIWFQ